MKVGDMPNTFGDSFPEEQLGSDLQVLRVFDEPETNDSLLPCSQLVLRERQDNWSPQYKQEYDR